MGNNDLLLSEMRTNIHDYPTGACRTELGALFR